MHILTLSIITGCPLLVKQSLEIWIALSLYSSATQAMNKPSISSSMYCVNSKIEFEDDLEADMVVTSLAAHVSGQFALALLVNFPYHNSLRHNIRITSFD